MEDDPEVPATTSRQRIAGLLREGERSFDELRRELEVPARVLEEDLRHLDKSLKRGPERLRTEPACCLACGFVFEDRAPRRFHAPSRCPRCRSERIAEPRFRIA
ncbi:MAG TPA: transcriptional regulator [Thermoanaerobaculia bacterium]|nr:transcriptional regulator [Thermoanaerobaculia bacterium]